MALVHFGDRFRLRWLSRKRGSTPLYIISAEKGGREYYPRMGSIAEAVLLVFAAPAQTQDRAGQPIGSRATVQLATTETLAGAVNTIGPGSGDHFLYYHPPGQPEQDWQIEVDSNQPGDGKLHSGDFVVFFKRDSERRMAQ